MERRAVLGLLGTGITAGLAGCSTEIPYFGDDAQSHPLGGSTTTLRVDDVSECPHNLVEITRDALDYWERASPEYVGFETEFELLTRNDPDVIIAFADEPVGCEDVQVESGEVLGCAPLVDETHPTDQPLTARVVAADRPPGLIKRTAEHEIGHLLGLQHDDEPGEIMSNDPAIRIPRYDRRIDTWETVRAAQGESISALDKYNDGIRAYNEEEFDVARKTLNGAGEMAQGGVQHVETALQDQTAFDTDPEWPTINEPVLTSRLDQLLAQIQAIENFISLMADAADAAAAGDIDRANELSDQADTSRESFTDLPAPTAGDIIGALGLVQGFEADEPIIDS